MACVKLHEVKECRIIVVGFSAPSAVPEIFKTRPAPQTRTWGLKLRVLGSGVRRSGVHCNKSLQRCTRLGCFGSFGANGKVEGSTSPGGGGGRGRCCELLSQTQALPALGALGEPCLLCRRRRAAWSGGCRTSSKPEVQAKMPLKIRLPSTAQGAG